MTDALGSVRALTNSSGSVTDSKSTDAFGLVVTASGSTPTPFGFAGNHGYQQDDETGLMRLGHRMYDASTGRFISRDPIHDGYNWYTYCENDPLNAVDPEGLDGKPDGNVNNYTDKWQFALVGIEDDSTYHLQVIGGQEWLIPDNGKGDRYATYPAILENGENMTAHRIIHLRPGGKIDAPGLDVEAGWDKESGEWWKIGTPPYNNHGYWGNDKFIIPGGVPKLPDFSFDIPIIGRPIDWGAIFRFSHQKVIAPK